MSEQKDFKKKTHLSEKELDKFKSRLLELKEKEEKDIEELRQSADNINADADDVQSAKAHHPADAATDDQLKKSSYLMIEKKKEKLEKIIVALDRIAAETYGICITTGKPIQKERLEAIPYAMHSVEAKGR